jgi:outer membrane immunogenic protein
MAEARVNKKIVLTAAAAALVCTPGTAFAADVMRSSPYYYGAPAPMTYNWTGAYVGANIGYQWSSATHSDANPNGFAGGIQGGYNWQIDQLVFGMETDLQASGADDTFASWKFSNPWFGTLRARAGYAMNNVLFFGTLGMAYGGGKVEWAGVSETNVHFGWTAGAGIEVGLTPNWSAKAEFLYVDLSDQRYNMFGGNTGFESSILRFGANYRF